MPARRRQRVAALIWLALAALAVVLGFVGPWPWFLVAAAWAVAAGLLLRRSARPS